MPNRLNWIEAQERALALTYPPTVLAIPTSRAVGHRLARPVVARGNQPSRPVALVDGLAVIASDLAPLPPTPPATGAPAPEASPIATAAGPISEAPDSTQPANAGASVWLALRGTPATNRKEDALSRGQAIPVEVGGEVPRGADLVIPLSGLIPEAMNEEEADAAVIASVGGAGSAAEADDAGGDERGPITEPPRMWDLPARFSSGSVEVPRHDQLPPPGFIPIGSWAHNREALLPEKTVLRPPELALLLALGIDEVEVYRRPVVGVVSLGPPLPVAGQQTDVEQQAGSCPLAALATYLARTARVAALPLGFGPRLFHQLVKAVQRWVQQVDILLLVGGSHLGPLCRGLDVLRSAGEVTFSGVDLAPGGNISAGKINGQPVLVMPGSLPDVLVGTVLFARPLMHKYLTPHLYEECIPLALEYGSQLAVAQTAAVPVRFSFDADRKLMYSRYLKREGDPWLEYARGQALVVLERQRAYADGEVTTAYKY